MGATGQTVRLSLYFFFIFTPFSSFTSILTHIYEDAGLPQIGPITLACMYVSFIFSTFCAPLIRKPLKMQLLFGGICYTLNYFSGFLVSFTDLTWLKYFITCSGSFIAGLSAGPLWVSQGRYIHLACEKYGVLGKKGQMFGIFSTIYCFSNVTAGLITTFGLGYFGAHIYFLIITFFGLLAVIFCIFFVRQIEDVPNNQAGQSLIQDESIANLSISQKPERYSPKEMLIKVLHFFPKMKMLLLVFVTNGISLGVYSSEIPHLIFSNGDKSEINKLTGYLMLFLGAGSTIGGLILSKIGDTKSTLFTGRLGLLLGIVGAILLTLTLYLEHYYLAAITAFEWGFYLFFIEGLMYLVCSRHFGGCAEAFSVNKLLRSVVYLIFQLAILPSGNKISLLALMITMLGLTFPALFLLNYIPVDYKQPSITVSQI